MNGVIRRRACTDGHRTTTGDSTRRRGALRPLQQTTAGSRGCADGVPLPCGVKGVTAVGRLTAGQQQHAQQTNARHIQYLLHTITYLFQNQILLSVRVFRGHQTAGRDHPNQAKADDLKLRGYTNTSIKSLHNLYPAALVNHKIIIHIHCQSSAISNAKTCFKSG